MFNPLIDIFLLAVMGSIAGLIGGIVFLLKKEWAKAFCPYAVPFAAGVLLAVSFLDLLPEAVEEMADQTFPLILIVFVMLFLFERLLFSLHHHDDQHQESKNMVSLVVVGDTIHNFLDGVTIAASYIISPSLALVVAAATFFHETPHEIADFGILIASGWSRKKAFLINLFSALATFPAAFLTYYFASSVEKSVGVLLAIAAGFFLYISATDFLPETKRIEGKSFAKTACLLFGVLLVALVNIFLH